MLAPVVRVEGPAVLNSWFRTGLAVAGMGLASSAMAFVPADSAANKNSTTAAHAGSAGPSGYDPPIQPRSEEAERAMSGFRVPEGMKASLIAAEPDLANPVAFSIDDEGRYWVCETFRQGNAVVDNRGREYWLLDDLAAQTVADRLAYYKKHLGEEGLKAFSEHQDRIRLLTDKNGDGIVDEATVFADGFNAPESGTGSGVLKIGKDVFYTNIPDVWLLRDTNGDGIADKQEALATGFGVRVAFRGHDMHGLVLGPDGRLYFSIGDRGFNVTTKEGKHLAMPDRGAVFRCELDGSNLEVFASGLRNPQELAFDDYGNLFTGDNNSDSGDRARWVYVAEGSDSGWRMYYQYLDDRGPWNREMMWLPRDTPAFDRSIATGLPTGVAVKDLQPAYILPPILNLADGPSGLTYYPGVGLSDRYKEHFFLCDFRGTPNNSGVRSFALKRKGASFEVIDSHEFIWSILATDNDFAPDGRFVISDWVNGWNGEGKGRVYALSDPGHLTAGAESAKLLAEDFSKRSPASLIKLFSHADRRVRQKAHLALASTPDQRWPVRELAAIATEQNVVPALHTVWAAGVAARKAPNSANAMSVLKSAVGNANPIIRAEGIEALSTVMCQWRKLFQAPQGGSVPYSAATALGDALKKSLASSDIDRHLRAAALQALARMGRTGLNVNQDYALRGIALALADGNEDPALRNAAQVALADFISPATKILASPANQADAQIRLGTVVALRRHQDPEVAQFLSDADPSVVTEAARAINDEPIDAATPKLAALAGKELNDPTLRRVLNANFRLGAKSNAQAVAKVAANESASGDLRVEALTELQQWADPPKTDRVTGMYRPVDKRDATFVAEVVRPMMKDLLSAEESDVRRAAIELASAYKIDAAIPELKTIASDSKRRDRERIAALKGLTAMKAEGLQEILKTAVEDESASVRSEGRSLWAAHDPQAAVPMLAATIEKGETIEKQAAIAALADLKSEAADAVLGGWLDRMVKNEVPSEIQLELIEAAEKREPLKAKLAAIEAARSDGDVLAAWRVATSGGDYERGKDIFFNRTSVSCQRCHKAEDHRGGEVGPDLSKIGVQKDRNYLLESLVAPNAKIAENFESVVVVTSEGQVVTGVKRAEDDKSLTLITAEGKGIVIPKDEIQDRAVGKSAMPEDLINYLSKRDARDLVEFLANQNE